MPGIPHPLTCSSPCPSFPLHTPLLNKCNRRSRRIPPSPLTSASPFAGRGNACRWYRKRMKPERSSSRGTSALELEGRSSGGSLRRRRQGGRARGRRGAAGRLYGSEQKDPGLNALAAHGTRAGGGSSHSGHSRSAGRRQGNRRDAADYLHDGEQAHRYLWVSRQRGVRPGASLRQGRSVHHRPPRVTGEGWEPLASGKSDFYFFARGKPLLCRVSLPGGLAAGALRVSGQPCGVDRRAEVYFSLYRRDSVQGGNPCWGSFSSALVPIFCTGGSSWREIC